MLRFRNTNIHDTCLYNIKIHSQNSYSLSTTKLQTLTCIFYSVGTCMLTISTGESKTFTRVVHEFANTNNHEPRLDAALKNETSNQDVECLFINSSLQVLNSWA